MSIIKPITNILFTSEHSTLTSGGQQSLLLMLKHLDSEKFKPIVICREGGELIKEIKNMGICISQLELPVISLFNVGKNMCSYKKK